MAEKAAEQSRQADALFQRQVEGRIRLLVERECWLIKDNKGPTVLIA